MSKEQENDRNALKTMTGIVKIVSALDWNSKNIHKALNGVSTLLSIVNNQDNEGIDGVNWDLNALIDNVFWSGKQDRAGITKRINNVEKYLKQNAND